MDAQRHAKIAGMMKRSGSPDLSLGSFHSEVPTFSRSQKMSMVPPRSPLVARVAAGGGVGGATSYAATAMSPGEASRPSRSTVRRPLVFGDTERLLDEKPNAVPRDVIEVRCLLSC